MPDEVDDLILQMQHLEAQARESQAARAQGGKAASLKTRAQQMAAGAQTELTAAQKEQADGEASVERARTPGLSPLQAADLLVDGRRQAQEGKTRVVKARARLDFALGQMDEAERQEWNALQADARAETHRQLAESADDSSRAPSLDRFASVAPANPAAAQVTSRALDPAPRPAAQPASPAMDLASSVAPPIPDGGKSGPR